MLAEATRTGTKSKRTEKKKQMDKEREKTGGIQWNDRDIEGPFSPLVRVRLVRICELLGKSVRRRSGTEARNEGFETLNRRGSSVSD